MRINNYPLWIRSMQGKRSWSFQFSCTDGTVMLDYLRLRYALHAGIYVEDFVEDADEYTYF
jgi:hypothetical protein